ncbi:hypothetical protein EDEG_02197 [Edhazardia aedis USNM 41457]|uniref:Uncharacterized protein n=1 Tax=Edhazardia aedis (strain USNM 41457) TaxID=1003232 RepID=J9DPZ3_EDHAE|nr:hypothetical protein EDEG_02197 [Edhazardia aedis USNM 41457]|eukprot:EJW03432.1 hypothetical protein EDEG_02197 [Edhazardia aedis USNM 41457]
MYERLFFLLRKVVLYTNLRNLTMKKFFLQRARIRRTSYRRKLTKEETKNRRTKKFSTNLVVFFICWFFYFCLCIFIYPYFHFYLIFHHFSFRILLLFGFFVIDKIFYAYTFKFFMMMSDESFIN